LEGRGVVVSPDETNKIVVTYIGYSLRRSFLAVLIFAVSSAAFLFIEPAIYVGDWSGMSLFLGLIPAAIYWWRQQKYDWGRFDDRLAGRRKVGLDRSPQDAKLMRFALSGWTAIGYCTAFVAIPVAAAFQERAMPPAQDWIWLAPLGTAVVVGLGSWSVLKARAIRAYRRSCAADE
jgi:hypothetical protein